MAFVVISAVTHQDLLQQDHVKTFFFKIMKFWYFQGHFDEQSFMDENLKKKKNPTNKKRYFKFFKELLLLLCNFEVTGILIMILPTCSKILIRSM